MPAIDTLAAYALSPAAPAANAAAVTPHNTDELTHVTRGIYVGGTGNLKVTTLGGQETTFTAVPVGTFLPVRAKIIWSTGTTATSIVALW